MTKAQRKLLFQPAINEAGLQGTTWRLIATP
jgi:hypothetical protein